MDHVIVLVGVVSGLVSAVLAASERRSGAVVEVLEAGRVERGLYIPARRQVTSTRAEVRSVRADPRASLVPMSSGRLAGALFTAAVSFGCLVEAFFV